MRGGRKNTALGKEALHDLLHSGVCARHVIFHVIAPIIFFLLHFLFGKPHVVCEKLQHAGIKIFAKIRIQIEFSRKMRLALGKVLFKAGIMDGCRTVDDRIVMVKNQAFKFHFSHPKNKFSG